MFRDGSASAPPPSRDVSAESSEARLEALADELAALAAQLAAGTARWLELVGEFDAREAWAGWGAKSAAHWIAWRCSMSPGAAREHVRVARRLRELPLIAAAFSRGELSFSKVRALARCDEVQDEQALLDLALDATASQLERVVRAYRGITDEEADDAARRRHLWLAQDEDGSYVVRGRLTAEDGALLVQALDAARQAASGGPGVSAETPPEQPQDDDPHAARRADALVHLCESFLAHGPAERDGGARHELVVHIDEGTLAAGRSELADGTPLAPEVARRLGCDSAVVAVSERHGRPVSVGRRTRAIPPGIRRALHARDPSCRFPGCTQTRWLDAHHVVHWAHGGETSLDNLVHLCRRHHRLVHEGGFALVVDAATGNPAFRDPAGRLLPAAPRAAATAWDAPPAGARIDARTLELAWEGGPVDLGLAVAALDDACRGPAG